MNENTTASWPDSYLGRIEFQQDQRDKPSWSRLSELESEMADLRGKVAIMERNQGDFEATLARILRALPATD